MLVVTPPPESSESMIGYVIRLTEVNGYTSPGVVLCYAGYKASNVFDLNCDLRKLGSVIGRDAGELSKVFRGDQNRHRAETVRYSGHRISNWRVARVLSPKRVAVCPECIRAFGYVDSFWDLTLATVCPKHRCNAISHCPECGEKLSWLRPGLLTCQCGADLRDFSPDCANAPEVELVQMAWSKLRYRESTQQLGSCGLPTESLDKMNFIQFMSVLFLVGQQILQISHTEALQRPHEILKAAAGSLCNWPGGFRRCLKQLGKLEVDTTSELDILRSQYGALYRALTGEKSLRSATKFLRQEIESFLLKEKVRGVLHERSLDSQSATRLRRIMTVEWICAKFSFSRKRLEGWCRFNAKDPTNLTPLDLKTFVLQTEIVSHLMVAKTQRITERKAAAMAHLPVSVMYELRKLGHVDGISGPKRPMGYSASSIRSLMSKLQSIGDPICESEIDTKAHVSFAKVLETATFWTPSGKADFVVAVLEGQIQSYGRVGDSLQLLYFEASKIRGYVEAERKKAANGSLTLTEAAQKIGVSSDCVAELANRGHLSMQVGPCYRTICERSVQEFTSVFITLNALAPTLNSSARALRRNAIRLKRDLLIVTSARRVKTSFLRRSEVEEFVGQVNSELNDVRQRSQEWHEQNDTVDKLRKYLRRIRKAELPLPRIGSKPNLRRIAEECGFSRNAFYHNSTLRESLRVFDIEDADLRCIDRRSDIEILNCYLQSITRIGNPVPTKRNGRINKKEIASEAGVDRNIFYKSSDAENLIARFMAAEAGRPCG